MGNIGGVHGGDKPIVEGSEAVSNAQLAEGGTGGAGASATDGAPGARRTARPMSGFLGGQNLRDQLEQRLAQRQAGSSPPSVDKSLVFLGMGDGAVSEAQNFAKRTAVTSITDSKVDDQITTGGKTYKLATEEGCDAWVKDIGLTGAKADEVSKIIFEAEDDARDEVAQMAKVFAEAQRGARSIERLVISGHSTGEGVWGDSNGSFELATLSKLAKAFPGAASGVEDFLYAGCYGGGESNVDSLRSIFPNLKTAFAYWDSAPGSASGATVHEDRWEAATRGSDPSKVKPEIVAGTRKGNNVATWNAVDGYKSTEAPKTLDELREDYDPSYIEEYLTGEEEVEDTQYGPVRDHYNSIQRLLQRSDLPAAERPALEAARDQTIRLNFYDNVKTRFQAAHAPKIAAGFAAVGLPAPDFSKLSRLEALEKIEELVAKLGAKSPKPAAAQTLGTLLTDGLRDLKASQIPNTWV